MSKTKVRQESGTCPKCRSGNLTYETNINDGQGSLYYPYICCNCEFEGQEWYTVEFDTHLDWDGNPIE